MAKLGVYKKPPQLQDEDKYGPFTKTQIVYIVVTLLLCAGIFLFSKMFYLEIVGMAIDMLLIEIAFLMNCKMPSEKYLFGGGIKIETLLLRIVKKKLKKYKVIFVKNYKKEN